MYAIAWKFPSEYSGRHVPYVFVDRFDNLDDAVNTAETCRADREDDCYRVNYQVIYLDGEDES